MATRVAIVDYGLCNLGSIRRALEMCGAKAFITADPHALSGASHVILPGVGAFPHAMRNLKATGMDQALCEQATTGVPLLGICLGMQLLASDSAEDGHTHGLGLISGSVTKLTPVDPNDRVPHIGWNNVVIERPDDPLFAQMSTEVNFYFVHSYHFVPEQAEAVIGSTPHCGRVASVVRSGNVLGTQFHPEKSQRAGFQLLKNFLSAC